MRVRHTIKTIGIARERLSREIAGLRGDGSKYAAGLATEGYAGGYRDALDDVILVLNGVRPERRGWWGEYEPE